MDKVLLTNEEIKLFEDMMIELLARAEEDLIQSAMSRLADKEIQNCFEELYKAHETLVKLKIIKELNNEKIQA